MVRGSQEVVRGPGVQYAFRGASDQELVRRLSAQEVARGAMAQEIVRGQEVAMRLGAFWVVGMSGVQEDIGSSGAQGVVKRPWGQEIQFRRFRRSL